MITSTIRRSVLRNGARAVAMSKTAFPVAAVAPSSEPVWILPTTASFHTSTPVWDDDYTHRDALVDCLTREFDEEKSNDSTAIPPALKEVQDLVSKDWKVVDDEDSGMVKLIKNDALDGNVKVQLSFHCQDTNDEDEGFGDDDEDEEPSLPVRFTVLASKAGQTMVIQCVSVHGSASIRSVAITNAESPEVLANNGTLAAENYQGPEFSELAEDLQGNFHSFVEEELGVNEDVAAFVAMYADFKEQTQYVNFLERCKTLLA